MKNGGPAFPYVVPHGIEKEYFGMSLRDYFAIHADSFDTEAGADFVAHSLGWEVPRFGNDLGAWFVWWRKADAAWRYAIADAMLAEREK